MGETGGEGGEGPGEDGGGLGREHRASVMTCARSRSSVRLRSGCQGRLMAWAAPLLKVELGSTIMFQLALRASI